jgi:hypothetical protein
MYSWKFKNVLKSAFFDEIILSYMIQYILHVALTQNNQNWPVIESKSLGVHNSQILCILFSIS